MLRLLKRHLVVVVVAAALAACGGGGGGSASGGGGGSGSGGGGGGGSGGGGGTGVAAVAPTAPEAARFLTQATFGPSEASIQALVSAGSYDAWITSQIGAPMPNPSHEAYVTDNLSSGGDNTEDIFFQSWWRQAVTSNDQLRQRVAFALSQIFVVSMADPAVSRTGAASYYDMLQRDAFGNFRALLKDVTLHPMMGRYLTYLGNQKEDAAGTRKPDENYAREVMQLMTIGLWELNPDGTQRMNNGAPIPTYGPSDIAGMAKVFTGLSWYHESPTNSTFFGGGGAGGNVTRPMIGYPNYHSLSEKAFLGTTIPANGTANVMGDIDLALDRLFNHANAGPFFAKGMIQRLVTSNPSPAYVKRVADKFADNGSGVRGDIAAVVRAILTDDEARNTAAAQSNPAYGKLREPVIRVTNWARAFQAKSWTGKWYIPSTSGNTSLSQSALYSPSVFNFWRPGFTPPGSTQTGQRQLLAPEFQVVDEVTVASYANIVEDLATLGIGWQVGGSPGPEVYSDYAAEIAAASDVTALVDRINLLLFYGQMSSRLRGILTAQLNDLAIPAGSNQSTVNTRKEQRARIAVYFSMISPEFLVQR